jgi:hypothetical protein
VTSLDQINRALENIEDSSQSGQPVNQQGLIQIQGVLRQGALLSENQMPNQMDMAGSYGVENMQQVRNL